VKNCNNSRLPWVQATVPKGAAAHSLGTTALWWQRHTVTNTHTAFRKSTQHARTSNLCVESPHAI